ncbi:GIY-YIG nuclease family protein [Salinimicrobium sp. GXAS 041]
MHSLYIIYSKTLDQFYVGETHEIEGRIRKHKMHHYKEHLQRALRIGKSN